MQLVIVANASPSTTKVVKPYMHCVNLIVSLRQQCPLTRVVHAFMCIYVWYLIVTLSGSGMQFRGFLIQARLMSDDTTRVGSFSNPPSGTRLSSCSPSEVCEWRIQTQNIFVNHELEKDENVTKAHSFLMCSHIHWLGMLCWVHLFLIETWPPLWP